MINRLLKRKPRKALILDAGALINFSMNGLLYLLPKLKKSFPGPFLITHQVKHEVIDRPIKIERFELGALRVKKLLDKGIIQLPEEAGITEEQIQKQTKFLMHEGNHLVKVQNKFVDIVSEGEMSCLALASLLKHHNIDSLIAIDERTTRILAEKPENLKEVIQHKMHQPARLATKDFSTFRDFKFARSSELVYVAHKKNLTNIQGPKALEALIFATKFKGSSISWDEVNELKKL
jgi:hypothetical protein